MDPVDETLNKLADEQFALGKAAGRMDGAFVGFVWGFCIEGIEVGVEEARL